MRLAAAGGKKKKQLHPHAEKKTAAQPQAGQCNRVVDVVLGAVNVAQPLPKRYTAGLSWPNAFDHPAKPIQC